MHRHPSWLGQPRRAAWGASPGRLDACAGPRQCCVGPWLGAQRDLGTLHYRKIPALFARLQLGPAGDWALREDFWGGEAGGDPPSPECRNSAVHESAQLLVQWPACAGGQVRGWRGGREEMGRVGRMRRERGQRLGTVFTTEGRSERYATQSALAPVQPRDEASPTHPPNHPPTTKLWTCISWRRRHLEIITNRPSFIIPSDSIPSLFLDSLPRPVPFRFSHGTIPAAKGCSDTPGVAGKPAISGGIDDDWSDSPPMGFFNGDCSGARPSNRSTAPCLMPLRRDQRIQGTLSLSVSRYSACLRDGGCWLWQQRPQCSDVDASQTPSRYPGPHCATPPPTPTHTFSLSRITLPLPRVGLRSR